MRACVRACAHPTQFDAIFKREGVNVWMRPYDIVATGPDTGVMEAVPDTVSLDSLKRSLPPHLPTLRAFFAAHFASRRSAARRAFVQSLAAYSVVCYLLQVKDRHNGNILLDAEGHVVHIDFGFFLGNRPGNINFESAPFKLSADLLGVLGGPRSLTFRKFRALFIRAFMAARKVSQLGLHPRARVRADTPRAQHREKIIMLVEMMLQGNEALPCFSDGPRPTMEALRQRFQPDLKVRAARCARRPAAASLTRRCGAAAGGRARLLQPAGGREREPLADEVVRPVPVLLRGHLVERAAAPRTV